MTKIPRKKKKIENDAQTLLDISINASHNKALSNERLIQLVKLLARQAAGHDYAQSLINSKSRW